MGPKRSAEWTCGHSLCRCGSGPSASARRGDDPEHALFEREKDDLIVPLRSHTPGRQAGLSWPSKWNRLQVEIKCAAGFL